MSGPREQWYGRPDRDRFLMALAKSFAELADDGRPLRLSLFLLAVAAEISPSLNISVGDRLAVPHGTPEKRAAARRPTAPRRFSQASVCRGVRTSLRG